MVARGLWAGALAGIVVGAVDVILSWPRLAQFLPGAGGRLLAALFSAALAAFALSLVGAVVAGIAGALSASIFSYVNSDQSDFTVSAMILAMVIIGGTGSVRGAIVGALIIAGYNQLAISRLGAWVAQVGQASGGTLGPLITALDPRGLSYLFFGLALYLAVLLRTRRHASP